jgi:hypothetical protein
MFPFRSPPTISKIQSMDSPGSPTGPYRERDTRLQSFLLHLSLKVPSKSAPPQCSPTGSLWREKLHLHRQWFIHSFISVRVPNKALSHEKRKIFSHRPCSPTWTEGLHTMGWDIVPQGNNLTLQSLPQCLAAFSTTPSTLAWVDQSPVSQHMS